MVLNIYLCSININVLYLVFTIFIRQYQCEFLSDNSTLKDTRENESEMKLNETNVQKKLEDVYENDERFERKFEDDLIDGFFKVLDDLFEDTNNGSLFGEARKKKKEEKGIMEKMLPMMVIPFMVSTSMIPMMLISLKFMLVKSAFIGKIAIVLMLLNFLRRRIDGGGVYSHNINSDSLAMEHYGYHGGDAEYGAYVNKRKKRRSKR